MDEFLKDPNIEYAEPNYMVYAHAVPNDPFYSYQWNFDNPVSGGINMEEAWNISSSHEQIIVAVVDTGVAYEDYIKVSAFRTDKYYRAPDLAQTKFVPGYDFVENDTHPNDDQGHGTHVAGTIAQSTYNNLGVAGIAYNTTIMPIKVLKKDGSGSSFDLADGITWASDHGAKVINLSLGSAFSSISVRNACEYAYSHGVTLVCSAGNDDSPQVGYPARHDPCCIAVGATRLDETRTFYSNYGEGLDVVAPGGDLNVDQNGDGYGDGILQQTFDPVDRSAFYFWFYQGTSMSAPHVSGVAALLLSAGVASTPQEVRQALQSTVKDLGAPGYDSEYGWGLVDAAAALNFNSETPPPPPPANLVPVANPGGPYTGIEDQAVTFNGSGSADGNNDPLTYAWNFGDGLNGSGISPSHTYANPGVYTITLIVNDGKVDSGAATTTADIQAANVDPMANPGGPYSGTVGVSINFNGSQSSDSDGSIVSYSWNFGDGTTANTVNPTHAYSVSGTFNVSLTVKDNKNAAHTASTTAQIAQPSPPPGPLEVFYDSFEISEWNGLWAEDAQKDWERTTFAHFQGRYAADVDGDTKDGALFSIPVNLLGKTNATVSFNWFIKQWLDTGEYVAFDISTDNGATWQEKGRLRGDVDPEEVWHSFSLELTNISSLKLRFRGLMNSSTEDAYIDQVRVIAK